MSREGQIQVELAQLTYLLPRLRGSSENLSRLGGGIGTRGPGETKLETDLRRIRSRISDLRAELKEVVSHRELLRKSRTDAHMPMGALVGYTNAGKSTLFNKLTGAQVLAADMLFATLDPTTRKVELPSRRDILLSDTVGFIKKLPHHLIAAFKATLEEVVWADFLLHVVDTSNLNYESQITAVEDVLQELNVTNKPVILVLNKIDKLDGDAKERVVIPGYKDRAFVSLRTEEGYQELISTIERVAFGTVIEAEYLFGYDNIGITQNLRSHAVIISEEYVDKGLLIKVRIDNKYEPIYKPFKVD
jgi:GTP-binding protein HflX